MKIILFKELNWKIVTLKVFNYAEKFNHYSLFSALFPFFSFLFPSRYNLFLVYQFQALAVHPLESYFAIGSQDGVVSYYFLIT